MNQEPNVTNRLLLDRYSVSLDKDELRRLFTILQERLDAAAELEVLSFKQLQQTNEEFEKNKDILRDGYKIRPTLTGLNGVELFGLTIDVFESPNFPETIKSIYINSSINLKAVHNYNVRNYLEMFIDFS